MGLLDRAKEQAQQAAAVAKSAAKQGQAKFEDMQEAKATDAILRNLGAAVYASHSGRAKPSVEADMESFVAQLKAREAEKGPINLDY